MSDPKKRCLLEATTNNTRSILVSGEDLLLAIDIIETAVHVLAHRGPEPRRGFDTERVRRVLMERLDCTMETFEDVWQSHIGLPDVFDFLRTNSLAIETSPGLFDASDFVETQMSYDNFVMDDDDQPRAAFHKLFALIAAGELKEADFR